MDSAGVDEFFDGVFECLCEYGMTFNGAVGRYVCFSRLPGDGVRDSDTIRVLHEDVVGSVVVNGGTKVKTYFSVRVPCASDAGAIVDNYFGAWWSYGISVEVVS